jgi:hypothetical protein
LQKTAEDFDVAMKQYKELYTKTGEPVRHYSTIEEFEEDYLK